MVCDCVKGVNSLHVHNCLLQLTFLVCKHLFPKGIALAYSIVTFACFCTLTASCKYFWASFFLPWMIRSLAFSLRTSILESNFFSFSSNALIFMSRSFCAASILAVLSAIFSDSDLGATFGASGFLLSPPPKSL